MNHLPHALAYAADALPVFPLIVGGKIPAVARGFYAATTNPETIKRFWRIADRNIGIPTGIVSGFWVVDVDPGGEDGIRRLEAEHGPLPETRTVLTPRTGFHFLFKYVGPVPSSLGRIAPNVDVKADGGYVAVVPSVTVNGTYSWLGDPQTELAIAPSWLLDLARKKPGPTISDRAVAAIKPPIGASGKYGQAALAGELRSVAEAPPGHRNAALNRAAFKLFQLVAGGELPEAGIVDQLLAACEKNGLLADDGLAAAEKTIASGRRSGLQNPRSRKGAT